MEPRKLEVVFDESKNTHIVHDTSDLQPSASSTSNEPQEEPNEGEERNPNEEALTRLSGGSTSSIASNTTTEESDLEEFLENKNVESELSEDRGGSSWKKLAKLIGTIAFQSVKEQFKEEESSKTFLTPGEEWKQKKLFDRKRSLPKVNKSHIQAGCKVRQMIANLEKSKSNSVNELYLEIVKSGSSNDVNALLKLSIHSFFEFDRNCVDENKKCALRLAIENRDAEMCNVLLDNKVLAVDCIYHAIHQDFYEGVKAILCHETKSTESKYAWIQKSYHFSYGMRPLSLAAIDNNFTILQLLYQHGHRLPDQLESIPFSWESVMENQIYRKAKASPAYITLICQGDKDKLRNVEHPFPMEYCFEEIESLRRCAKEGPELRDFYRQLEHQVEDYMCSLLDQVQSSRELAALHEYDHEDAWFSDEFLGNDFRKGNKHVPPTLDILAKACEKNLIKFVNHSNAQMALSHLSYRETLSIHGSNPFKIFAFDVLVGMLFPVLSLLHIIAPYSKAGDVIFRPNVLYGCHLMSTLTFFGLLFASVIMKSVKNDYLGAPPTWIEWLIIVWVCGKWMQEKSEFLQKGFKSYLLDWWNYNDLLQLSLFTTAFILRVLDYVKHSRDPERIYRANWSSSDPRLWSTAILGWAYVITFLRVLGLSRRSRTFGPLTASLAKMLVNVIHFLFVFGLIMLAFALGLTEVYWYYGTSEGMTLLCNSRMGNTTSEARCRPAHFSDLGQSIEDLFWALFGQIELSDLFVNGNHRLIEIIGITLVGTYHVIAIIILINMLIAMMTRSFENTSENRDAEWKFQRAKIWINFVRRDLKCPPPMNLIPNVYHLCKIFNNCCSKSKDSTLLLVRKKKQRKMQRQLVRRFKYSHCI